MSQLKELLTIKTIRQHPKLAKLAYKVISPYIEIFNNLIVQFTQKCIAHEIITDNFTETVEKLTEQLRKRIKLNCSVSIGRDSLISYYLVNYEQNLLSTLKSQGINPKDKLANTNVTGEEYVAYLKRLKLQLNNDETEFILDFLIALLQNVQVLDDLSLIVACNLFPDMIQRTNGRLDKLITENKGEEAELL